MTTSTERTRNGVFSFLHAPIRVSAQGSIDGGTRGAREMLSRCRLEVLGATVHFLAEQFDEFLLVRQRILVDDELREHDVVGDGCAAFLLSTDRCTLEPTSVHHPDPAALALARSTITSVSRPSDEGLFGQVVRTGEPLLVQTYGAVELEATAPPQSFRRCKPQQLVVGHRGPEEIR